jgi:spore maturation protein CgeB
MPEPIATGRIARGFDGVASTTHLRILHIALGDKGSCRSRRKAIERLGHEVDQVNFYDHVRYLPSSAVSIYARTLFGPAVSAFNRAILHRARDNRYHWAWVDKGTMVFPRVIRALQSKGLFTIHHLTDDFFNPRFRIYFRNMKRAIPDYHVHLTSNLDNVRELREAGAPNVIRTYLGFDPELVRPGREAPPVLDKFKTDVAFIGFWRPHLDDYLAPLMENGIDFLVQGLDWDRSPRRAEYGRRCAVGMVPDSEYPSVYASAKIGLCFLNRDNRNTSTMRSFEIPAIGAFMLGERTEEHLEFFKEGKEAEFFDTPDEMLEKILYYLAHDEERERIAEAGRRRALTSGYSYHDIIRADLERIMPIYEEFSARRSGDGPGPTPRRPI